MGGVQSSTCRESLQNPDMLNVVTLSDSAVQRLPMEVDDSPLDKEQRNKNIDDFWRDRLDCIDSTFSEWKNITDKEFLRLEFAIKKLTPEPTRMACPRLIEDAGTCYAAYEDEPLQCSHVIDKFLLCMDTLAAEGAKRAYLKDIRDARKKKC